MILSKKEIGIYSNNDYKCTYTLRMSIMGTLILYVLHEIYLNPSRLVELDERVD